MESEILSEVLEVVISGGTIQSTSIKAAKGITGFDKVVPTNVTNFGGDWQVSNSTSGARVVVKDTSLTLATLAGYLYIHVDRIPNYT